MKQLILGLFLCISTGLIAQGTWNEKDISPILDEILDYHIEYKQISPQILSRSSKIFLQNCDSLKLYLLQEEVDLLLESRGSKWEKVAKNFDKKNYSFYHLLFQTFQKSILRAKEIRSQLQKELILQANLEPVSSETYIGFARNTDQLKLRIKKQMVSFLHEQKMNYSHVPWNVNMREKILSFMEKKLSRQESAFIQGNESDFTVYVLKALAKSLDAHTAFFSNEEAFRMRASLEKEFEGLGIVFAESIDGVLIKGIVKGSPADRANQIEEGDFLVGIDGKSINEFSYEEVMSKLKNSRNVSLNCIRVLENGKVKNYEVTLKAEKIVMDDERLQYSVETYEDGVILTLVLPSFYESSSQNGCEADIRKAIREVKKQHEIRGVILDLRENSGGFLHQAVKVAGLFITNGVVVISKYSGGEIQYLRQVDGRVYYQGPLVILTSKASASAAEIVAQALQDYGTALIVGDDRTYGKGTIQYQTVTDKNAKAFYKVTVGKYYTVSGKSTQIEGVRADIVVPTRYSTYNIGERFLEYPLPNDFVASAYIDPLTDLDKQSKNWFQKNYLPNLQKKEMRWRKMLPDLQRASQYRLAQDAEYFETKGKNQSKGSLKTEDKPLAEAHNIIKDMIDQNFKEE